MKISSEMLERRAEDALRICLEQVPFLQIEEILKQPLLGDARPDFVAKLRCTGEERQLVAEVKSIGQPRAAREAINQLYRYLNVDPNAYGVFIAPYISPRAAEICAKEGVGYLDLAGNCRLVFDRVYIERQGKPNPFSEKRDLRSLYSAKATRVLRVLLVNPKKAWKVQELAKEAAVSLGQTSNVKRRLEDREWLRKEPDGFLLANPEATLTEWADNYTFRKNRVRDFYSMKSVAEVEAEIARACGEREIPYALTGFSGAARLAPAVRYQRAMAYVGDRQDEVASVLGLKEVSSGANVSLLAPYDAGVFYGGKDVDGLRVAAAEQIYLDLAGYRGRGEEAAAAILAQVIRPKW